MNATPIGGDLLAASLEGVYFTETVDVLANAGTTRDSYGHLTDDWETVTGLSGLAAAVGSDTQLHFSLVGSHAVTTEHRLRWRGSDYRITGVYPDATGTTTPLSAELVVPSA